MRYFPTHTCTFHPYSSVLVSATQWLSLATCLLQGHGHLVQRDSDLSTVCEKLHLRASVRMFKENSEKYFFFHLYEQNIEIKRLKEGRKNLRCLKVPSRVMSSRAIVTHEYCPHKVYEQNISFSCLHLLI